jgi:hypothetical protein
VSGESQPDGRPSSGRLAESLAELTDAQRQSVAAASAVFEQLIDEVRQREMPRLKVDELLGQLGGDANGAAMLTQLRGSVARAIDLYADLLGETFTLYADAIEQVLGRGGGARGDSPSRTGSPVTLTASPGEVASAAVWLHNVTPSPLAAAQLRLTSLTAHDGGTLHDVAFSFAPPTLDVAAGSSASSTLSVTLPADAVPGAYHGQVLASGAPTASVPVLLTVR